MRKSIDECIRMVAMEVAGAKVGPAFDRAYGVIAENTKKFIKDKKTAILSNDLDELFLVPYAMSCDHMLVIEYYCMYNFPGVFYGWLDSVEVLDYVILSFMTFTRPDIRMSNLVAIEDCSFCNSNITSAYMPKLESVKRSSSPFFRCEDLREITIPKSLPERDYDELMYGVKDTVKVIRV